MRSSERMFLASPAFVGIALAGLAGLAGLDATARARQDGGAPAGPPPTSVRVVRLAPAELQERRRVTGELRAVRRSRVATNEPGLVTDLPVEEGTLVRRGDVVAEIDHRRLVIDLRRLESRMKSAAAAIEAMDAEMALQSSDVEAIRGLATQRASNKKELADAESEVRVAAARLEGARRDLDVIVAEADLMRVRIDDTTIRAPIDGVVVGKSTERGEWVAEGDAIVEIVSSGAYEAWLDVPQRYASNVLGRRDPVQIMIEASGNRPAATVPTVVPQVDRTARTFAIYLPVADVKGVLAPGMSVIGWVPTGDRASFLTIPRDALMRNQAGFFVYAARGAPGAPPVATPVPIRIEFETEDAVAVRPGTVNAGDLIVVEGNERLFPMMPLAPIVLGEEDAPRAASIEPARNGDS